MKVFGKPGDAIEYCKTQLRDYGSLVSTAKWQGIEIKDKPEYQMWEKLMVSFSILIPEESLLEESIKPNLPWADEHFKERISGMPLNPGDTYKIWPFYRRDKEMRNVGEKFSHTYMERFWPKFAGNLLAVKFGVKGDEDLVVTHLKDTGIPKNIHSNSNHGIRYEYGDLRDVIDLLKREPDTRQAYLPVWFPEDTGVKHGGRVPCSIGYHFIIRGKYLHTVYQLRSCDFLRHFRDDIYLAMRLAYYILNEIKSVEGLNDVKIGSLTMHITSLHIFASEKRLL